jgi:hypothetical protein
LFSIGRGVDLLLMYPDKKRIKLLAYGSLFFALQFIVDIVFHSFVSIDFGSVEKYYEVLGIVLTISIYPFFSWEYWYNKQWKYGLLVAFILLSGFFLDKYLRGFFLNKYDVLTQWFYYIKPLFSTFSWCGFLYGFTRGGWKDGIGGFIIGVLFYFLLGRRHYGNVIHFVLNKNYSIDYYVFSITFIVFTRTSLGFAYYYLLNYYTTRKKLINSFSEDYKKFTLQESLFYPSFILLYTVFISSIISLKTGDFIYERFYFEGSKIVSVLYTVIVIIVLFVLIHSLSNLVIQKLYQLKISIGITYLLLFVPVINIIVLIYLYRKEKSGKTNPAVVTSVKNTERFENEDYKKLVIILNIIGYVVTLALTNLEYTQTGLVITIAFYTVNLAFLGGLYFYRYAWIGMLISLLFLTFFRFYFNIADSGLIIQSLVSSLAVIYLYVQSFHPISLDAANPHSQTKEEETTASEVE